MLLVLAAGQRHGHVPMQRVLLKHVAIPTLPSRLAEAARIHVGLEPHRDIVPAYAAGQLHGLVIIHGVHRSLAVIRTRLVPFAAAVPIPVRQVHHRGMMVQKHAEDLRRIGRAQTAVVQRAVRKSQGPARDARLAEPGEVDARVQHPRRMVRRGLRRIAPDRKLVGSRQRATMGHGPESLPTARGPIHWGRMAAVRHAGHAVWVADRKGHARAP